GGAGAGETCVASRLPCPTPSVSPPLELRIFAAVFRPTPPRPAASSAIPPVPPILDLSAIVARVSAPLCRPELSVTRFHGMVTVSDAMRELFALLERVAKTESSVLLRGETGTGKEIGRASCR